MTSSEIIAGLKKWSSCDVADGLGKLGVPHGGFLDGLTMFSPSRQSGPTKLVGPVFTAKFVPKSDTDSPKFQGHYIDQVPADAILFVSQPTPHINAVYGGLMSLRAQKLGAAGVVIDGRLRDLQEHRKLGISGNTFTRRMSCLKAGISPLIDEIQVFAQGIGTTAGGEVCRPSQVNVPVKLNSSIQEAWINPGDYLVADLDGVVCVPQALAEKVLEVIPPIVEADSMCAEGIRDGRSVGDVFKTFRGK